MPNPQNPRKRKSWSLLYSLFFLLLSLVVYLSLLWYYPFPVPEDMRLKEQ